MQSLAIFTILLICADQKMILNRKQFNHQILKFWVIVVEQILPMLKCGKQQQETTQCIGLLSHSTWITSMSRLYLIGFCVRRVFLIRSRISLFSLQQNTIQQQM